MKIALNSNSDASVSEWLARAFKDSLQRARGLPYSISDNESTVSLSLSLFS